MRSIKIQGQIDMFDLLKPKTPKRVIINQPNGCVYSGHECNKKNLWDVAEEFDDVVCPHSCCRLCNEKLCGARCSGAIKGKQKDD